MKTVYYNYEKKVDKMAVTIKDIAAKAGVSISTVSKVMNNSSVISEKTKTKVNTIISELNYMPNTLARNLSSNRSYNIVYLTLCKEHEAFYNPHMFEIMCGIKNQLALKSYTLMFESINNPDEGEPLVKKLICSKTADGIIIHGSAANKKICDFLTHCEFPYIIIGKPNFRCSVNWIDTNQLLSGEMAAEHLWQTGRRNIAFIGGNAHEQFSIERLRGSCFALKNHNCIIQKENIILTDSLRQKTYEAAISLLSSDNKIDSIICQNNTALLSVYDAINHLKLAVPDDIAVIGFDDFPLSRLIDPSPTVVDINVYQMGIEAAKTILKRIANPSIQIQSYTTIPYLIKRTTT